MEILVKDFLWFIDGHMIPNEGPGFGIELNEGYIAANITKNMEAVSITA